MRANNSNSEPHHTIDDDGAVSKLTDFDKLPVQQGFLLVDILADETSSLTRTRASGNSHCVSRDHQHGNAPSPSLSITYDKTNTGLIRCKCFGNCQFSGSLSNYLLKVGERKQAEQFWTPEKIRDTITKLGEGEYFELGWRDFIGTSGISPRGGAKRVVNIVNQQRQSNERNPETISLAYHDMFQFALKRLDEDPSLSLQVSQRRGWTLEVIRSVVAEGLMFLRRTDAHPDDVQIGFSYSGLYEMPEYQPTRIIKTTYLQHKSERTTVLADKTYNMPVLGDFSSPDVLVQKSEMLIFAEGEPDCVTLRHITPDAGIICIGNKNQYANIIAIVKLLNMANRTVVYAIDRDVDAATGELACDIKNHIAVLNAIIDEKPSAVHLWMCPLINGKTAVSKDINDFYRENQSKSSFLKSMSAPIRERVTHATFLKAITPLWEATSKATPKKIPPQDLSAMYYEDFSVVNTPESLAIAKSSCATYKWDYQTCCQMINEGLLSFKKNGSDTYVSAAFIPTIETPAIVSSIQTRSLSKNSVVSVYTCDNTWHGDFTPSNTVIQYVETVFIVDRISDCIKIRHSYPDAGIICLDSNMPADKFAQVLIANNIPQKKVVCFANYADSDDDGGVEKRKTMFEILESINPGRITVENPLDYNVEKPKQNAPIVSMQKKSKINHLVWRPVAILSDKRERH